MSTDKRNVVKRIIAPGIWQDGDGNVHWSIPGLLAVADIEDTPANRLAVMQIVKDVIRKRNLRATFEYRDKPDYG